MNLKEEQRLRERVTALQHRLRAEGAESNRVIEMLRQENASLRVNNRVGGSQVEGLQKELQDQKHALAAEHNRFKCMSDRLMQQEKIIEKQEGTITLLRAVAQSMLDNLSRPAPLPHPFLKSAASKYVEYDAQGEPLRAWPITTHIVAHR